MGRPPKLTPHQQREASKRLVEDTPENHPQADAAFWSSGGRRAPFFIS